MYCLRQFLGNPFGRLYRILFQRPMYLRLIRS